MRAEGDRVVREMNRDSKTVVSARRGEPARSSWSPFAITLGTAFVAAAAGLLLRGAAGWGAAIALALLGSGIAFILTKPGTVSERQNEPVAAPSAAVKEREEATAARLESERMRRQIELATATLRDGKDPLTEVPELRVGPLHGLLEAIHSANASGPVISRIAMSEEELLGAEGGSLPRSWPQSSPEDAPAARVRAAEALGEIDALLRDLEALASELAGADTGAANGSGLSAESSGPAAGLVDALVHTAADGIEDLAAGLMRASELASVAEQVTNRATLVALNAALEATRSGSEPFAAIAEETRRLAEYAREATDTMTRLAGEIESKVERTITAIHADSEDAKRALAALGRPSGAAEPAQASAAPAADPAIIRSLIESMRAIRDILAGEASSPDPHPCEPPVPTR
jgi:methyl-accepting chemotaxis protein-like sensor